MKCERMIPSIYRQSSDMRTLCRIIDAEMEILEYYTNHILDCYSPEHCPQDLLDDLADHIGFKYQELKSVMYNRVVLKNFIKNLIRYRGSATGIRNAAAIDIRYRQTERIDSHTYKQVPMNYHESIDIDKTWVDVDNKAGIIYLFIIASNYFEPLTANMTDEEREAAYEDRMRKLLDLAYLQEYVRPVGMYLLPMVARKVNPYTDLTVKAVRIPDKELNTRNNVFGVPNASMEREYDRIHFASVDNPNDEVAPEPWLRTLYHSQVSGELSHRYFTAPVYHIEGNFLYYDHDQLLNVYEEIIDNTPGLVGTKIGDSLYNPNRVNTTAGDYSYGKSTADGDEPLTIQDTGVALVTDEPLAYDDHVGFPLNRAYQLKSTVALPVITEPDDPYPIYLDVREYTDGEYDGNKVQTGQIIIAQDTAQLLYYEYEVDSNKYVAPGQSEPEVCSYMDTPYYGTHQPETDEVGDNDDGTNKNLMINLFTVDSSNESEYTGADDIKINGKDYVEPLPVPYDPETNDKPVSDDVYFTVNNVIINEDPEKWIP